MRNSVVIILSLLLGTAAFAQKKKDLIKQIATLQAQNTAIQKKLNTIQKAQTVNMENELHNFSYAMGVSIGSDLKDSGADSLSYAAFALGLEDIMKGDEKINAKVANEQVKETLDQLEKVKNDRLKEESNAFMAKNGARPKVVTTESGLQYQILTQAEGIMPKETDSVKVHYAGTLIDGTEFDSSIARDEPYILSLNRVIKGWTEALKLMPVGSKWKLYIPYDLAYGERGAGGVIPPFAALIFELELLEIISDK